VYIILFNGDGKSTLDHLLSLGPFADVHQVKAEVVIGDDSVESVFRLVKKLDRLFQTGNSLLRPA
jgi:hypothetical protein